MEFKPNSHPAPTEHQNFTNKHAPQTGPFDPTQEQVEGHSTYAPHHVRGPGGFTHHSADPNQHLGQMDQSPANRYHGIGMGQPQENHVNDPASHQHGTYQGPSPVYAKNTNTTAPHVTSGQVPHGNHAASAYPAAYNDHREQVPHPSLYADTPPPTLNRSSWWRVPTLLMSGAFLALVAVGFGFFLNERTSVPTGEIPRISASLVPEREAPKDPGGMEIPNRDIHVVNTMDLSTTESDLAALDAQNSDLRTQSIGQNQPILNTNFSVQSNQATTSQFRAQSGIRPANLDTAFATDPFADSESDQQSSSVQETQNRALASANSSTENRATATGAQTNINDLLSAEDTPLLEATTQSPSTAAGNSEATNRSINDLLLGLDEAAAWTEGRLIRRRLGLNLRRALEEEAKLENVSFQDAASLEISGLNETIQRAEAKALAEREARLIRQQVLLEREKNLNGDFQPNTQSVESETLLIPSFGRNTRVEPSRPIEVDPIETKQVKAGKNPDLKIAPQKPIRIRLSGPMSPMAPFDLDSAFFDDTILMQEARLSLNKIRTDVPTIDQRTIEPKAIDTSLGLTNIESPTAPSAKIAKLKFQLDDAEKANFKAKVFDLAESLERTRQSLQRQLEQNRTTTPEIVVEKVSTQSKLTEQSIVAAPTLPQPEPFHVKQRPLIVDASAPALVVLPSDQAAPLSLANQDIDRNQESLVPLIQQQQVAIHALAGPEPQKPLVGQFAQVSDYQALDKSMLADPLIDSLNAGDGIQVAQLSLDGLDTLPILDSEAELPLMVQEVDAEIDLMNQQLNQQQEQQAFAQQQQNAAIANQQQQLAILRQQADSNGPPQDSPFGNAPIPFRPIVPAGLNGSSVGKPYAIQIASVRKRKMASMAWQRAQKKFPELLGDMVLNVETARVRGKTFYRVQAGPVYNRMTAADICVQLKGRKQDCIVAKRK